jgi:hypothetical protein
MTDVRTIDDLLGTINIPDDQVLLIHQLLKSFNIDRLQENPVSLT